MIASTIVLFAIVATGLAQVPAGYRHVYIASNVDKTFVVVPTSPKSGSTTVVFVLPNSKPSERSNVSVYNLQSKT